jgi:threonine synthase
MEHFLGYRCSLCNQEYSPEQVQYTCPKDGGNLDVVLDYATILKGISPADLNCKGEASLWRYLPLLPVADPGGAGTPLHAAGWNGRQFG